MFCINFLSGGLSLAKNHNNYCPRCGEKLKYSKSKKAYYCINPGCSRYNGSVDREAFSAAEDVKKSADDTVGSLFE